MADEDVVEPQVEVPVAEEAVAPSETEEKALKMGWTPKSEFKGDPAKWRSAEEFVERGETMLPIVKAQVAKQAKEIDELKAAMKEFGEYHTKTEKRAYENALASLKQQRANAIATGDGLAFDRIDDEIGKIKRTIENTSPNKIDPAESPEYKQWEAENKWVKDPELEKYAFDIGKKLRESGISVAGKEFLDLVGGKVKALFPEKFENPRRALASSVEGGSAAPRRVGKSFADLPADAKNACERMAKNAYGGDEKQMAKFKAEYVKNYDWS